MFTIFAQVFGSPSTPILENPEHQTRWYFKYFLGRCEYFLCEIGMFFVQFLTLKFYSASKLCWN